MRFYENLPNAQSFDKFYAKKPHLLKRHEKDIKEKSIKDKYFDYANNFQPSNLKEWIDSFGKLYEFEKYALCKVDRDGDLIILSYYQVQENNKLYLLGRIVKEKNGFYEYAVQQWKLTNLFMLYTPQYAMGYSKNSFMYLQRQTKLDGESLAILKSMPEFKYLPIEKFWKINVVKLFDINKDTIYQYELLLKGGYTRLASDMLVERKMFNKKELPLVKPMLKKNIRLATIEHQLYARAEAIRVKKERLKEKQAIAKFNKLHKVKLDLGDFIIKTPDDASELKQEGLKLKHCVYNYLKDIVNNETKVLFLRKKTDPDTPFYTIEIKKNEVMQVRGLNNKAEKKYIKLVENWHKKGLIKGI